MLKRTTNQEIRALIKSTGYPQWEIGELIGYGESSFSRLLRKELPIEQKRKIISLIEELKIRGCI